MSEGEREGEREGGREGGREGERERGREGIAGDYRETCWMSPWGQAVSRLLSCVKGKEGGREGGKRVSHRRETK